MSFQDGFYQQKQHSEADAFYKMFMVLGVLALGILVAPFLSMSGHDVVHELDISHVHSISEIDPFRTVPTNDLKHNEHNDLKTSNLFEIAYGAPPVFESVNLDLVDIPNQVIMSWNVTDGFIENVTIFSRNVTDGDPFAVETIISGDVENDYHNTTIWDTATVPTANLIPPSSQWTLGQTFVATEPVKITHINMSMVWNGGDYNNVKGHIWTTSISPNPNTTPVASSNASFNLVAFVETTNHANTIGVSSGRDNYDQVGGFETWYFDPPFEPTVGVNYTIGIAGTKDGTCCGTILQTNGTADWFPENIELNGVKVGFGVIRGSGAGDPLSSPINPNLVIDFAGSSIGTDPCHNCDLIFELGVDKSTAEESYNDTSLSPTKDYEYIIQATNNETSTNSTTLFAQAPVALAVENLTANADVTNNNQSVTLTWDLPTGSATINTLNITRSDLTITAPVTFQDTTSTQTNSDSNAGFGGEFYEGTRVNATNDWIVSNAQTQHLMISGCCTGNATFELTIITDNPNGQSLLGTLVGTSEETYALQNLRNDFGTGNVFHTLDWTFDPPVVMNKDQEYTVAIHWPSYNLVAGEYRQQRDAIAPPELTSTTEKKGSGTWTDPLGIPAVYEYSLSGTEAIQGVIASIGGGNTTYTDTTVDRAIQYNYTVISIGDTSTAETDEVSVLTHDTPDAVQNLQVDSVDIENSLINISWDLLIENGTDATDEAGTGNPVIQNMTIERYDIFRRNSTDAGEFSFINSVEQNVNFYNDTGQDTQALGLLPIDGSSSAGAELFSPHYTGNRWNVGNWENFAPVGISISSLQVNYTWNGAGSGTVEGVLMVNATGTGEDVLALSDNSYSQASISVVSNCKDAVCDILNFTFNPPVFIPADSQDVVVGIKETLSGGSIGFVGTTGGGGIDPNSVFVKRQNVDTAVNSWSTGGTELAFILNSCGAECGEFGFKDFEYLVRGVNQLGAGANSTEAEADGLQPPHAPLNLTVTADLATALIDWDEPTTGGFIENYTIFRLFTAFEDDFSTDKGWIEVFSAEPLSDANIDFDRGVLNYTTVPAGIDTFYVDLNPLLNGQNLTDANGNGDFVLDVTLTKVKDSQVDDPSCSPCNGTGSGTMIFMISEFAGAHGNQNQDAIGFNWKDTNTNPFNNPTTDDGLFLIATNRTGADITKTRPAAASDDACSDCVPISDIDGTSNELYFRLERIGTSLTVKSFTDESRTTPDGVINLGGSGIINAPEEIPVNLRYLTITDQGSGDTTSQQRYEITRIEFDGLSNQNSEFVATVLSPTTFYNDTSVSLGTVYNFTVNSNNAEGTNSTDSVGVLTNNVPTPARNLQAQNIIQGPPIQVDLIWDEPFNNGTGEPSTGLTLSYDVFRRNVTAGDPFEQIATDLSNTFYNDTNGLVNAVYQYTIQTDNELGTNFSNSTNVTVNTFPLPEAPINLEGEWINITAISLTWEEPFSSQEITNYNVYRSDDGSPFSFISVNTTQTGFIDNTVSNTVRYDYQVTAVSSAGEGDPSQTEVITPPVPFAIDDLTSELTNSIFLNWTEPENFGPNITNYLVQRADSDLTDEEDTSWLYRNLEESTSTTSLTDTAEGFEGQKFTPTENLEVQKIAVSIDKAVGACSGSAVIQGSLFHSSNNTEIINSTTTYDLCSIPDGTQELDFRFNATQLYTGNEYVIGIEKIGSVTGAGGQLDFGRTADNISGDGIKLSGTRPFTFNVTSNDLALNINVPNYTTIANVTAPTTNYTDNNTKEGITHYYRVIAENDNGQSDPSNIVNQTENVTSVNNLEDNWLFREHDTNFGSNSNAGDSPSYAPELSITQNSVLISTGNSLGGASQADIGDIYMMHVFNTTDITGANIKVTWNGTKTGGVNEPAEVRVYDGAYNASDTTAFPYNEEFPLKGNGLLGSLSSANQPFSLTTQTLANSSINYANSSTGFVTVMIVQEDNSLTSNYDLEIQDITVDNIAFWDFSSASITHKKGFNAPDAGHTQIDDWGLVTPTVSGAGLPPTINDLILTHDFSGSLILNWTAPNANSTIIAHSVYRNGSLIDSTPLTTIIDSEQNSTKSGNLIEPRACSFAGLGACEFSVGQEIPFINNVTIGTFNSTITNNWGAGSVTVSVTGGIWDVETKQLIASSDETYDKTDFVTIIDTCSRPDTDDPLANCPQLSSSDFKVFTFTPPVELEGGKEYVLGLYGWASGTDCCVNLYDTDEHDVIIGHAVWMNEQFHSGVQNVTLGAMPEQLIPNHLQSANDFGTEDMDYFIQVQIAEQDVPTSYQDFDILANTTYSYQVTTTDLFGESLPSNTELGRIDRPSPAPFNLNGTVVPSLFDITLTWNGTLVENQTGWQVQRRVTTVGGAYDVIIQNTMQPNNFTFTDTTPDAGVEYDYRVAGINFAGLSDFTNVLTILNVDQPLPSAPENLTATTISEARIDLDWDKPSFGEPDEYVIERKDVTGGSGWITIEGGTGTSVTLYIDQPLLSDNEYSYRVRGTNPVGTGPASNIATNTTFGDLPPITDLTATPINSTAIFLNWTEPVVIPPADYYLLLRESPVGGGFDTTIANLTAPVTEFTDNTLQPDTIYNYVLQGFREGTQTLLQVGYNETETGTDITLAGIADGQSFNDVSASSLPNSTLYVGQQDINFTDIAGDSQVFVFSAQQRITKTTAAQTTSVVGIVSSPTVGSTPNEIRESNELTNVAGSGCSPLPSPLNHKIKLASCGGGQFDGNMGKFFWNPPLNVTGIEDGFVGSKVYDENIAGTSWGGIRGVFANDVMSGTYGDRSDLVSSGNQPTWGGDPASGGKDAVITINLLIGSPTLSNEASAETTGVATAPQNLQVFKPALPAKLNLEWETPLSDDGNPITGYQIERQINGGGFVIIVPDNGLALFYNDTGLPIDTFFDYRVSAINTIGVGPASNVASGNTFGPPPEPDNLQVTFDNTAPYSNLLTWDAPFGVDNNNVTDYTVQRFDGNSYITIATTGNTTSYTDNSLLDLLEHSYRVSATTSGGQGEFTTPENETTSIPPTLGTIQIADTNVFFDVLNTTYTATVDECFPETNCQLLSTEVIVNGTSEQTDTFSIPTPVGQEIAWSTFYTITAPVLQPISVESNATFTNDAGTTSVVLGPTIEIKLFDPLTDLVFQHERTSDFTGIDFVIIRQPQPWSLDCEVTESLFDEVDIFSISNVGTWNTTLTPVSPFNNAYVTCFDPLNNDKQIVSFTSFGLTNGTGAVVAFTNNLGDFLGVPVPFIFILFLAAIWTGRSASTGIIFLAVAIGAMGVLGYFPDGSGDPLITGGFWSLIVLLTILGVFMGKRFF